MTIRIRRYESGDAPAIDRLNARLADAGFSERVGREPATASSEERGDPISKEMYVAADDDEIRGGVWLHEHLFCRRGQDLRAAWVKYPVAESLGNRTYAGVPGALLFALMRRQPRLMALGMGHASAPLAQLLAGLGWTITPVPFHLMPVRPARVFRLLPHLRRSPRLARITAAAARTGLASVGCAPLNLLRRATCATALRGVSVTTVEQFGDWTDELWHRCRASYGFVARRDAAMLNAFYPATFRNLTRLHVQRDGRTIGWMCVTLAGADSAAAAREFGGLRVGMLVDGFGHPDDARVLLAAGLRHLIRHGADLVVTNQVHRAWRAPLPRLGFLPGPSNFMFASSRPMSTELATETAGFDVFLNRGDCDGPPRW